MIHPKIGFIVYGVHKDGLQDTMGQPFIDGQVVAQAKQALGGFSDMVSARGVRAEQKEASRGRSTALPLEV